MFAIQDELGTGIVVVVPVLPRSGIVALSAVRPQGLLVFVIFNMTSHTSDLGIFESRCGVALGTRNRGMFPEQGETGKSMVELRHFPGTVTVALLTLLAFLAFMLVVLLMTGKTIQRRFSETAQVFMAGVALDSGFTMCVAQDKFGALMPETPLGSFPIFLTVTVSTFLAQRSGVLVILFVASQTLLRRLLEHGAFVALLALGFGMLAKQRKTGLGVIKLG